jgi:hypothetical protein
MKTDTSKILSAVLFFIFLNICYVGYAQKADSAKTYSTGTIMSSDNATLKETFRMSGKSYDDNIIGVYREDTLAEKVKMYFNYSPIVSSGITYVRYNSETGLIKKGDFITSSSETGVGMKAIKTGMVLGVALEDATSASGLVKIRVLIQYVKQ